MEVKKKMGRPTARPYEEVGRQIGLRLNDRFRARILGYIETADRRMTVGDVIRMAIDEFLKREGL